MKQPSNSSTQGGIVAHSRRSAERSAQYHAQLIDPVRVRRAKTKMTRSEHQLNSLQDFSEKGHKL